MTRNRKPERLGEFVRTATQLFIAKGYRRTQMADVTQALGLSPGSVYRYVESKEGLFDLVVRAAACPELPLDTMALPVPAPPPGATLAFLRNTLRREGRLATLQAALGRATVAGVHAEFEAIVRELYRRAARYRVGVRLLDRSSLDWPELATVWAKQWRAGLIQQLARYLELRGSRGLLRPLPDPQAWARLIVETVSFFAMHRHFDPYPTLMEEAVAEDTAVLALLWATVAEAPARPGKRGYK